MHSGAMPADGLTKGSAEARAVTIDLLARDRWRLVHDDFFALAKKRAAVVRHVFFDDAVIRECKPIRYGEDEDESVQVCNWDPGAFGNYQTDDFEETGDFLV
ncbi:unnamed protein product [Prorocentrum cordatum]|uniref:Uncharacterized protein n=1 Tax=Prorocentrum cordatum TaxID=2364126 RepID=A0ABN9QVH4_9DINO|nr:unnamed protein product [Polarella glacialis]